MVSLFSGAADSSRSFANSLMRVGDSGQSHTHPARVCVGLLSVWIEEVSVASFKSTL